MGEWSRSGWPVGMVLGDCLDWLLMQEGPAIAILVPELGSWQRGRGWLRAGSKKAAWWHVFPSALGCRCVACPAASEFLHWLPSCEALSLGTVHQINSFSSKLLFIRIVYHSDRNEARTFCFQIRSFFLAFFFCNNFIRMYHVQYFEALVGPSWGRGNSFISISLWDVVHQTWNLAH